MTQKELISKYGNPLESEISKRNFELKWMMLWTYPIEISSKIPSLGKGIYINKDFQPQYEKFLRLLIERNLHNEIKTNDECFMPRYIRGYETQKLLSRHTWATAVDLNATDNPLNVTREQAIAKGLKPFTAEFIQTIRDAGLTAGYDFPRCDGMHIEMR